MSYNKRCRVAEVVKNHPYQCDFIFSSFYAAVFSERYESRASPFPSAYLDEDGEKSIEYLRKLLLLMPPFSFIIKLVAINIRFIDFLDWLFTVIDPRCLEPSKMSIDAARRLGISVADRPTLMLTNKLTSESERRWNRLKGTNETRFAFYGTDMENMYLILNHGLNPLFSTLTDEICRKGIYLVNKLSVGLTYSSFTNVWRRGLFKSKIRVLVMCEIINDESVLRCIRRRHSPCGLEACVYVQVKDKRFVRPKYFFIYTESLPPAQSNTIFTQRNFNRMFYLMLIFFMCGWLYVNRNHICVLIQDTFFKKSK